MLNDALVPFPDEMGYFCCSCVLGCFRIAPAIVALVIPNNLRVSQQGHSMHKEDWWNCLRNYNVGREKTISFY
jgi:hypothetical protein